MSKAAAYRFARPRFTAQESSLPSQNVWHKRITTRNDVRRLFFFLQSFKRQFLETNNQEISKPNI